MAGPVATRCVMICSSIRHGVCSRGREHSAVEARPVLGNAAFKGDLG